MSNDIARGEIIDVGRDEHEEFAKARCETGHIFWIRKNHMQGNGAFPHRGDSVEFVPITMHGKKKVKFGTVQIINPHQNARRQQRRGRHDNNTVADQPEMPYTFVPVVFRQPDSGGGDSRLSDVVWRDGRDGQSEERLSGALRCELTALTPLLVGQYRAGGDDDTGGSLEPLMLKVGAGNGLAGQRVLLPGPSIKGMLRHSIGALLAAPMEQVQEQYYFYRPNMLWVKEQDKSPFAVREAVVCKVEKGEVTVQLLLPGRHAWFVEGSVVKNNNLSVGNNLGAGKPLVRTDKITQARFPVQRWCHRNAENWEVDQNYRLLDYKGGTDGAGKLAWAGTRCYQYVAVPECQLKESVTTIVDKVILEQYRLTQDELANESRGHLSNRHPNVKGDAGQPEYKHKKNQHEKTEPVSGIRDEIGKCKKLQENQLIYVEIDKRNGNKIVSVGHHYYYRWRHADSVRGIQKDTGGTRERRPELRKVPGENVSQGGGKLNRLRNLMGYVDEDPDDALAADDPLATDDNFKRMAGRVSVNFAIEQVANKKVADRFVCCTNLDQQNAAEDVEAYTIPLKIQGMPRPSWNSAYLDQNKEKPDRHYGYLAGHEPSGVALAGRKFYRHQKVDPQANTPFAASGGAGNQSTKARFISAAGTKFRFTVRFRDLAPWELGVLALALSPDTFKALCNDKDKDSNEPVYAQKLGNGKALGLGSVNIGIEATRILNADNNGPVFYDQARSGLLEDCVSRYTKMANDCGFPLAQWLEVMNYAGRGTYAYLPLKEYARQRGAAIRKRRVSADNTPRTRTHT